MSEPEVQWKGREFFAEIAEALELPSTLCVISARFEPGSELWAVLFTDRPEAEGDEPVWSTALRRDAEGILRPFGLHQMCTAVEFEQRLRAIVAAIDAVS
jgi:hypothetical protein